MRIWLVLQCLLFVLPAPARAKPPSPDHTIGLAFAWDLTWTATLRYARGLTAPAGVDRLAAQARLTLPMALLPELSGWRLTGGLRGRGGGSAWAVEAEANTGLAHARDATGHKTAWIGSITARPGYFDDTWSAWPELTARAALATYMRHDDRVRDLFADRDAEGRIPVDGPQDGWFAWTGWRLRAGLGGRFTAWSNRITLAGGLDYAPQFNGVLNNPPTSGMPFFMRLEVDRSW